MQSNLDLAFLQMHHGHLINDGRRFNGDPAIESCDIVWPLPPEKARSIHDRRIDAARIAAVSGAVRVAGIAATTLPRRPRRRQADDVRDFFILHLIGAAALAIGAAWGLAWIVP